MSRPRKEIDGEQVRKLAALHCTVDEIADILECSRDTIYRHQKDALEKGRAEGKMRLRTMQFKSASNGSASMLIWLGKQMLGQKDQQEVIAIDEEEKRLDDAAVDDLLKKISGSNGSGNKNKTTSSDTLSG
ncbi:MAG: hypothetical protein CMF45_08575 [Legionellales bacterium]|nr:hypothetical protein [Legionellales bacterium]